jgi:hypothetical protein
MYNFAEAARDACNHLPAANFRETYALLHANNEQIRLRHHVFRKGLDLVDLFETKETRHGVRRGTSPNARPLTWTLLRALELLKLLSNFAAHPESS